MRENTVLVLAVLILLLIIGFTGIPFATFTQGPEGISVDIYKVVYNNEEAIVGNPTTYVHSTWTLKVVGTKNIVLEFPKAEHITLEPHGNFEAERKEVKDPTDVEIRVSLTPISFPTRVFSTDPYPFEIRDRVVEWETKVEGKIVKRKAVIVTADTWVEIKTIPNTGFDSVDGVYVWLIIRGVSWRNYVEEPESPEGYRLADRKGAFIPVLAYVKEAYDWAWVDSKDKSIKSYPPDPSAVDKVSVYPSGAGDVLTLFHQPSEAFVFPHQVRNPETYSVEPWLATWTPDWTMKDTVYTKIYIRKLQPHVVYVWGIPGWIDKAYYPSTVLKIRIVCLAVGEFTYVLTEKEAEEIGYTWEAKGSVEQEFSDVSDWLDNAWQWLNSPQGMFTMFLILIGFIVFLLAYTGTLPIIIHVLSRALGGGKG